MSKIKKAKLKLIVEYEDGKIDEIEEWYEDCHYVKDIGVILEYEMGSATCTNIIPNGHERLNLKLWKKCDSYESFIAKGTINNLNSPEEQ